MPFQELESDGFQDFILDLLGIKYELSFPISRRNGATAVAGS